MGSRIPVFHYGITLHWLQQRINSYCTLLIRGGSHAFHGSCSCGRPPRFPGGLSHARTLTEDCLTYTKDKEIFIAYSA
jgi:hypothetical protein